MSEVTKTPKQAVVQSEVEEPKKESLFEKFVNENRRFWLCFNFWAIVISIGMAVGTFFVVTNSYEDCSTLKNTLWLVIIMHGLNFLENLLNLTGLDKKICSGQVLCGFFVVELTILIYMQVSYFEAMQQGCIKNTPLLYFWLMG